MLYMKIFKVVIILIIGSLIFVIGCKDKQLEIENSTNIQFKSEKYGFSFSYPRGWEEVTKDLPERWALLDKNKNTILFLVNRVKSKDLLMLGRTQALKDSYPDIDISDLKQDKIKEVIETVKLDSFNDQSWYTYGIKFSDKNIDSLVSGTLCGDNEIMLVLVSDYLFFDKNKNIYTKMLSTFEC